MLDYNMTEWRTKEKNGSVKPYGYVYARCATGSDSSIMVRKKAEGGSGIKATDYVTVPYYVDTQIKNTINVSKYPYVRLRIKTKNKTNFTGGVWSPDSSKLYSHVVG